jgi:hypothetical protein
VDKKKITHQLQCYLHIRQANYLFLFQAMKIVNVVKLKEEFDYESLCRKLESQVDHLTAEIERQQKLREDDKYELEKQLRECQDSFAEARKVLVTRSEVVIFPACILLQIFGFGIFFAIYFIKVVFNVLRYAYFYTFSLLVYNNL